MSSKFRWILRGRIKEFCLRGEKIAPFYENFSRNIKRAAFLVSVIIKILQIFTSGVLLYGEDSKYKFYEPNFDGY